MTRKTVLLIDDDKSWARFIGQWFEERGFEVIAVDDALRATDVLQERSPDVVVTDYFMNKVDGGKLCQLAKALSIRRSVPTRTVILTGGADRGLSTSPSRYADVVIAKNRPEVVLEDLARALGGSIPDEPSTVIGHERLQPRALTVKLHNLKNYLKALHEGVGDAVFGLDDQHKVFYLNSLARELLDVAEVEAIGRPFRTLLCLPPNNQLEELIDRALRAPEQRLRPLQLELRGSVLRVGVTGLPDPSGTSTVLLVARDISDIVEANAEREAMARKLHLADKLSAMGQLVAGISHEINNPLTVLLLSLNALEDRFPALEQGNGEVFQSARQVLTEVVDSANRISRVTRQMRSFSHSSTATEEFSLDDLVQSATELAAMELRYTAAIELNLNAPRKLVGDHSALSQAFVNIILNAMRAVGEQTDGERFVRLTTAEHGRHVHATICNSGPRISAELLPRIFEPFFTTRDVGEGTGLGLSLAYDAVTRHGGVIEIDNEAACGVTFRISLPFDTGKTIAPKEKSEEEQDLIGAKVLVVDDEPSIRRSFRRVLEPHFDVTVAGSGPRALELLVKEDRFDVILCDLLMPLMTGMELYAAVEKRQPELARRFVFVTGGAFSSKARGFLETVQNPRVYKPVLGAELVRAVRDAARSFNRR